jgi:hypothetical protein
MARRGRPPLTQKPIVVRVALYLYPEQDDDLIQFFDPIPVHLRSGAVKQALRSGKLQVTLEDLPSDEDIESALDNLIG